MISSFIGIKVEPFMWLEEAFHHGWDKYEKFEAQCCLVFGNLDGVDTRTTAPGKRSMLLVVW